MILRLLRYFTKTEWTIWGSSIAVIILAFCLFDHSDIITLIASLLGVTSLIFSAKGHPIGQFLMIVFSILYGIISYSFAYYGEMITYLGMTLPMSVFAFVSWLKNPYAGKHSEVKVNTLSKAEGIGCVLLTALVTLVFHGILTAFHTANLLPSTLSVATSFMAVYLTFRRSPYYALAYAANDIILIVLWGLAAYENRSYLSVVVCFTAFLCNDLYCFINWRRIRKRQQCSHM